MKDTDTIELLYVAASSRDRRGKRVLVRDPSGPENYIYPEDGVTQIDMDLLGISEGQKGQIEAFFTGTGEPPGAVG